MAVRQAGACLGVAIVSVFAHPSWDALLEVSSMNRPASANSPDSAAEFESISWEMVEATPDALVVADESGVIERVNRQTEVLFGYERAELLGRKVEMLLPERFATVHRAHRTRYRAAPEVRSMGTGMELLARRRDGTEFPVEVSLSPLRSGDGLRTIAAVRDVSERVAAGARNAEVRSLLDAVEDGVYVFDAETLRFTYVNQGAIQQVGYSEAELLTMTPLHIKPAFVEASFREVLAPLLAGDVESTHFDTLHRRRDGVDIPVEIVLQSPGASTSSGRACVALVRDISQRIERESELTEVRQQASLLAERERIARDMHDNVLGRLFGVGMALQGTASLVTEPAVSERLERLTGEIDEALREIRATVYGLRSRQEWGQGVRGQILAIAADQRPILGFEPKVEFSGPIGELPSSVSDELLATLRESLTNVAKYADASHVSISTTAAEGYIRLIVADNGVGFGDPDAQLIDNATDTTGRGLRNMSARAQSLGGRLVVSSTPGDGATIDWCVPSEPPQR